MLKRITSDLNKSISAVFSVPTFKEVFKYGHSNCFLEKLAECRKPMGIRKNSKVKSIITKAYQYLSINYRNEYLYKNIISNRLLLEMHDLNHASIIDEFRIANSIADILIINGTNTIYEIKTELDSPGKLRKQITDYKKVSPKINLVTHHSLVDRYSDLLSKEDSIGLISLKEDSSFDVVQESKPDTLNLCVKTMMSTLTKSEYTDIIFDYFGYLPKVSNIRFYKDCQSLVEQLDPKEFHSLMLSKLTNRRIVKSKLIKSHRTPIELKHICLSLNPSKVEYENLYNFLNLTI